MRCRCCAPEWLQRYMENQSCHRSDGDCTSTVRFADQTDYNPDNGKDCRIDKRHHISWRKMWPKYAKKQERTQSIDRQAEPDRSEYFPPAVLYPDQDHSSRTASMRPPIGRDGGFQSGNFAEAQCRHKTSPVFAPPQLPGRPFRVRVVTARQ